MAGTGLGALFVRWLIFQSLYKIRRALPLHGGVVGDDPVVRRRRRRSPSICSHPTPVARVLYTWRWSVVALWFTAVVLMILVVLEFTGRPSFSRVRL